MGTAPIAFVHATELVDPSPWLSGGELVLTTGLGFEADSAELGVYVRRLRDAGVACLGFGTGLSHNRIPSLLLAEADAAGLPVLEVPFATPFAAVVRTVMNKIAEQEYEQVLRAAQVQTRITRAALRGGVDALVKELAIATSTEVAYIGVRTEAVHPNTAHALVAEAREILARRGTSASATSSMSVSEPGRTLTMQPVGLSTTAAGHLAMVTAGPVTGVEQVLLGHAVSLLTLELEKPARLRAEQTRLHTVATALLLDGRFDAHSVPDYLVDAADAHGRIRVLTATADRSVEIARRVDERSAALGRDVFLRHDAATVSIVLKGDDDAEFAEWLLPEHPSLRAGLSAVHSLSGVMTAAEQARLAMSLAASGRSERLVDFGTARGSLVLASEPVRRALLTMAVSTVNRLAAHDAAHGGELLASLRAYLEANGQWETAAAQLGVHRHTLRGRISRIEDLLDVDLASARVRAELLLSILASDGAK